MIHMRGQRFMRGFVVSWVILFCMVTASVAGPALDAAKKSMNEVLAVLKDPSLRGEAGKKAKKEKIKAVSGQMFDLPELSKRTLAQNWNRLTPDQRTEFMDLYRSLLEDAYVDKIASYTDEKVLFLKEVSLSENTIEVQSIVYRKGGDVPVNYRMINRGGQWKVYDVVIEGVSLVNNYRAQFREILGNQTPEALLEILRKKVSKR